MIELKIKKQTSANRGFKKTGFTIVEVLLVVAIIGILSSIGMVSYGRVVARHQLEENALEVRSFINGAVLQVKAHRQTRDIGWNQAGIFLREAGTNCAGAVLDSAILRNGVQFVLTADVPMLNLPADVNGVSAYVNCIPLVFNDNQITSPLPVGRLHLRHPANNQNGFMLAKIATDNRLRSWQLLGDVWVIAD
jgi:prepilin-type N-terminal cleavage/methylation domain-containing protein